MLGRQPQQGVVIHWLGRRRAGFGRRRSRGLRLDRARRAAERTAGGFGRQRRGAARTAQHCVGHRRAAVWRAAARRSGASAGRSARGRRARAAPAGAPARPPGRMDHRETGRAAGDSAARPSEHRHRAHAKQLVEIETIRHRRSDLRRAEIEAAKEAARKGSAGGADALFVKRRGAGWAGMHSKNPEFRILGVTEVRIALQALRDFAIHCYAPNILTSELLTPDYC